MTRTTARTFSVSYFCYQRQSSLYVLRTKYVSDEHLNRTVYTCISFHGRFAEKNFVKLLRTPDLEGVSNSGVVQKMVSL